MKTLLRFICWLILIGAMAHSGYAQEALTGGDVKHKIIKQNGASFTGTIVSQDAREILIETETIGLVYIPRHEVDEIILITDKDKATTGGLFATRYFLTTNGFNISKGDNYVQWSLFGPDFQFGVADNFTMGVMTSWVGMPIIATTKYSVQLNEKLYGGAGFLGGTGSWAFPKYGLMLPYAFLTAGDRINNINFSFGYGALFTDTKTVYTLSTVATEYSTNSFTSEDKVEYQGRPLFSLAGMFRINDKFSFVFDSFIMTAGKDRTVQDIEQRWDRLDGKETYYIVYRVEKSSPLIVLSPGLRFQANEKSSFQFGFTGIHFEGEFVPVPIPMVQWFRRI